jgi:hypothetical protein
VQNGETVEVTLTLTGIMAAAHLRGAWGTLSLLQNGAVSTDENGTSILRYIDEYGGYDSPSVDEAIAFFTDRLTGDEGGTGGGAGAGAGAGSVGNGSADVDADSADVVVTWNWGNQQVVTGFDPAEDTIFVGWVSAADLEVSDTEAGVVFALPSNGNSSVTLAGVTLADLSAANFTILDNSAAEEILGLIGGSDDGGSDGAGDGDDGAGSGHGDGHGDGGHGDGGDGSGDGGDSGHGDGDSDGHGDGDDGAGDGHGGGDGHDGHTHQHVYINLTTPAQVIDGFRPDMGDMIEIEGDVSAEDFLLFEESGDALGQTVRIAITTGGETKQIIFTGFGLDDLTQANITAVNADVQNEIATTLGTFNTQPGVGEGYELSYDNDGSNPPASTGVTDAGGTKYKADVNADDIVGFDPAVDELDFGGTSVHGMIVTKSEAGEIVIDSPWGPDAQIVQGVTFADVTIDNFGVVGNEHFRQDMGGVISWEQGVGPRAADTVYLRSHEYGSHEVIDGFDPTANKISLLYFGTRERLSVEDSDAGLVISTLPSGQSFTFTGVSKADLIPGMVEFHFDQVMEDNLEAPFGFDQNDVTLVDRTVLLTPEPPAGASTDGSQTRTGDLTGSIYEDSDDGDTGGDGGGSTDPLPDPGGPATGGDTVIFGDGADSFVFAWSYGSTTRVQNFDTSEDVLDFNSFSPDQLDVREVDGDLVFEVLGNGGDFTVIEGIQAEDLSRANLTAPSWNGILNEDSALMASLVELGFDLG